MNTIRISGKEYQVKSDRFGNQSINGMSVDAFMKTLTDEQLAELIELGKKVASMTLSSGPQAFMDAQQQAKNKN